MVNKLQNADVLQAKKDCGIYNGNNLSIINIIKKPKMKNSKSFN